MATQSYDGQPSGSPPGSFRSPCSSSACWSFALRRHRLGIWRQLTRPTEHRYSLAVNTCRRETISGRSVIEPRPSRCRPSRWWSTSTGTLHFTNPERWRGQRRTLTRRSSSTRGWSIYKLYSWTLHHLRVHPECHYASLGQQDEVKYYWPSNLYMAILLSVPIGHKDFYSRKTAGYVNLLLGTAKQWR